jgi:protein-glutamine gamma-glutamyltransferase
MAFWSGILAKPAKTPLASRPSLTLFFLLSGAFLLTLVPHIVQFPVWVTVTVVGAMLIRSVLEFYRLPLPSLAFTTTIAVIFFGVILLQFGTIGGREAGTALTAGLLAIKFYELRRLRDVALISFSCFFIVMSALLYSQVLELFIYCLIMMWVLTALLLRVHTGDLPNDRLLRMLSKSGVIFLQALPLATVLFLFFPRYAGNLSLVLEGGTIGLSQTVSPGSVARLSQDDSEAMYVQFTTSTVPAPNLMYWRALVLWSYVGGSWTPGQLAEEALKAPPLPAANSLVFSQEITVREHNQRWLFALDAPVSAAENKADLPPATIRNGDILQLLAPNAKLDHQVRYDVTSASTLADEALRPGEREIGTRLPDFPHDHIDQSVKDLADQLHQGLSDSQQQEYVSSVLRYFHHSGFVYSTSPGIQGPDWLPVFLFQTKTGFCEHFASAFAVLMRLKHIPARLVVGYQGADYNPYTDHYIVYQSNAHAWDEVWIDAKHRWMRVDPTALLGAAEANQSAGQSADQDTLSQQIARHHQSFSDAFLPPWARAALRQLQLRRDQVETSWDNLVFSYDPDAQFRLAHALGFGEKASFALFFVCLVAGGICMVVFKKMMLRQTPVTPVENLYATFCRNMAQRGIPRATWEGPLAYTERVAEAFPDDKLAIQRVGSIVAHVRYGPNPVDAEAPHQLKSLLTLLTASQAAATSRDRR